MAPTSRPLISILMTSYNYARFIPQAIQSVLDQTLGSWELIVVDDASTDGSLDAIRSFSDSRILLGECKKNVGGAAAYNMALRKSRGEYVCCLDSDDAFTPEKLASQLAFFKAHPEVDVLGTFVSEIGVDGSKTGDKFGSEAWFNQSLDLNAITSWLWRNHLCHSSVMMRREFHDFIGEFNDALISMPDFEFWLRCHAAGAKFAVIAAPLTLYRHHGDNITRKEPERFQNEYAYAFCSILKPDILGTQGTLGIVESISSFVNSPSFALRPALQRANLLEQLLAPEPFDGSYPEFVAALSSEFPSYGAYLEAYIGSASRNDARREDHLAKVLAGKAWLEEEVQKITDYAGNLKTAKEYLERELLQRNGYVNELQEAKDYLEGELTKRDLSLKELGAAKSYLHSELAKRDASIQELDAARKYLDGELSKRDASIQELVTAKKYLDGELSKRDASIQELVTAKKYLDVELSKRDASVKDMVEAKKYLDTELSKRLGQIAELKESMAYWQGEAEKRSKHISELLEVKTNWYEPQMASQKETIDNLTSDIRVVTAEREMLIRQRTELQASLFWKILGRFIFKDLQHEVPKPESGKKNEGQ
jgi:glycosyltransferase involved in cell wall biosynthesis